MATKAFQKIYTKISQITKATCSLKASGVGYDELAMVNGKLAQVVKIMGDEVTLQVFEGTDNGVAATVIESNSETACGRSYRSNPVGSIDFCFQVFDLTFNAIHARSQLVNVIIVVFTRHKCSC